MKRIKLKTGVIPLVLGVFLMLSCQKIIFRSSYEKSNSFLNRTQNPTEKEFLKAHLKNGEVYIWGLDWSIDEKKNAIIGKGYQYNAYRKLIKEGDLELPISEVAIFETNQVLDEAESSRMGALTVLGVADWALGVFCLINPKACFGSCPTFYLNPNSNYHYADAEGFSSATLPRLAYADADALPQLPAQSNFEINMRNEAMETHVIKGVRLKVFPKEEGKTVLQTSDQRFYSISNAFQPVKATGFEGNILPALLKEDHFERFSLAHSSSMQHQETVELEFEKSEINRLGLQLSFRQTLMTTYLFYSALDDMGEDFAEYYAKMESTGESFMQHFSPMKKLLGGIQVEVFDESKKQWISAGNFGEIGPIAIEKQMIELPQFSSKNRVKIRLKMNQGLWRIDAAKLVGIDKEVQPIVVEPSGMYDRITKKNVPLPTSEKPLVTFPGRQVQWKFSLPSPGNEWVAFLESEGYYLEWSRSSWTKDKNMGRLMSMGLTPKSFLKKEIKAYKKFEETMEREFWDSRFTSKDLVYENR